MRARRTRYLAPLIVLALAAIAATFLISSGSQPAKQATQVPLVAPAQVGRGSVAPGVGATGAVTATYPLRVRREDGKEVVLNAAPRRIASLSAGATEILFAIGAADQVAAVSADSDFPAEAQGLPKADATLTNASVSVQRLDLVIVVGGDQSQIAALDALGVPVVALPSPATVVELEQQIQFFGDLSGHLIEAQRVAVGLRRRVDALQRQLANVPQGPRVYLELGGSRMAAPNSLAGDLLTLLKAQNVAPAGGDPYPALAADAITAKDPEVIVLAADGPPRAADLKTRPGWASVSAVRAGRVEAIEAALLTRPGPRIADGLLLLEQIIYPTLPSATPR